MTILLKITLFCFVEQFYLILCNMYENRSLITTALYDVVYQDLNLFWQSYLMYIFLKNITEKAKFWPLFQFCTILCISKVFKVYMILTQNFIRNLFLITEKMSTVSTKKFFILKEPRKHKLFSYC